MKTKLIALICFGIAFAFVEAVVVVYLRRALNYDVLAVRAGQQPIVNFGFIAFIPLGSTFFGGSDLVRVEILREIATIIMLISVAYLAARRLAHRLGAFLIAFSLWDIFYYVFLRLLIHWPENLMTPDIFFLIPVAWIGPVLTPIVISTVLLIIGVLKFTSREV